MRVNPRAVFLICGVGAVAYSIGGSNAALMSMGVSAIISALIP